MKITIVMTMIQQQVEELLIFELLSNNNINITTDKPFMVRLINSIRCFNIPLINFIILLILIIFN